MHSVLLVHDIVEASLSYLLFLMAGLLIRMSPLRASDDRHRPLCWPSHISAVVLRMVWDSFINHGLWCHNNPLRELKAGDSFGAKIIAHIKNLSVFTHPHSPTFTADTDCSLESVNCVWTPPQSERKATPWKWNRKLGKNRISPPKTGITPYFVV